MQTLLGQHARARAFTGNRRFFGAEKEASKTPQTGLGWVSWGEVPRAHRRAAVQRGQTGGEPGTKAGGNACPEKKQS